MAGASPDRGRWRAARSTFVLWAWPNPHLDKSVEKIAIEAAGPAFVIGGITLSDLDEEPICREGTREVIITPAARGGRARIRRSRSESRSGRCDLSLPIAGGYGRGFSRRTQRLGRSSKRGEQSFIRGNCRESFGYRAGQARRGSFWARLAVGEVRQQGRVEASSRVQLEVVERGAQLGAYQGH